MNKKESRKINGKKGRRSFDQLTPGMVLASGFVSLMGAPARLVAQWGMVSVVVWTIGDALLKIVRELKGTTTFADIQIGLGAVLSVNPKQDKASSAWPLGCELLVYLTIGAIVIAGIAILYAYRERNLRNQAIQEMGLQLTTLEKYFDPNRSSSGLANTGETHPRDR